ncbi:DUF2807 domain-containing protein [candidate division GN15 bacterium]|uniref:DUF2807 domain-containing protein n=1 Tax=candidate division GN15 bacterium TaxID=2072418 RepID=A0A855X7Q8_9BACT|nr:MAG: DUF2807 domain-containing protein [candidate division GN15 bacterium]
MRSRVRWFWAIAALCAMAGASAQAHDLFDGLFVGHRTIHGSGTMATQIRDVGSFTKIEVTMGIDVYVTVGSPQQVKLTFDDNIIDRIRTRVRGNTLEIDTRSSLDCDSDCKIEITVPAIEAFSLAGSGNIEIHGVNGDEFSIDLAGSGDIRVSGKTRSVSIDVAGSGDIDTRELIAEDAEVDIAGSGNVRVYAEKSLEADVSGSGDIRYYGDPENVESDVSGSGSIRRGRG